MPYSKVFSVDFSLKDQTIFISNQYRLASEGLAALSPVASDAMLTTVSWRQRHPDTSGRSCDDTSAINYHACDHKKDARGQQRPWRWLYEYVIHSALLSGIILKRETCVLRYILYLFVYSSQIVVDFCQTNNNDKKELHTKTASKKRMRTHTFRKCHKHRFSSKKKANKQ